MFAALFLTLLSSARAEELPSLKDAPLLGEAPRAAEHVDAPVAELRARVKASRAAFREASAANGGDYVYVTRFTSWVGFGYTLKVEVDDGKVVAQTYRQHDQTRATTESWVERGASLGTHERTVAPTVDAMYARCLDEALTQPADRTAFYVSFFDDGVLAACTYRDLACVDDCSSGPDMETFRFGAATPPAAPPLAPR
ncbi:MAG: hypothetical protein EP330_20325 [Deltaproteobacteria bacterium]|nr:MAG: hypothetical protein EP330_20325 [Deltaproteobacteria bacterium]